MPETLPTWIFPQLERLAVERPDRLAEVIAHLLEHVLGLESELTAMAVEEELLSADEGAGHLGISVEDMESAVHQIKEVLMRETAHARIARDANGVARIVDEHVAVWEVVREYRRLGAVEAVSQVMPMLSEVDIRLALTYAGRNPDEIGVLIQNYEAHQERARAAYPFARVN